MHSTGLPSYLWSPSTSAPTRRSSERFQLPAVFLLPSSVCVLSRQRYGRSSVICVCVSVGHDPERCKHGWSDRDAVLDCGWAMYFGWGPYSPTLRNIFEWCPYAVKKHWSMVRSMSSHTPPCRFKSSTASKLTFIGILVPFSVFTRTIRSMQDLTWKQICIIVGRSPLKTKILVSVSVSRIPSLCRSEGCGQHFGLDFALKAEISVSASFQDKFGLGLKGLVSRSREFGPSADLGFYIGGCPTHLKGAPPPLN